MTQFSLAGKEFLGSDIGDKIMYRVLTISFYKNWQKISNVTYTTHRAIPASLSVETGARGNILKGEFGHFNASFDVLC